MNANKVIIAVLVCSFIMLFGFSYAWYHIGLENKRDITLTSGTLQLVLEDNDDYVIQLENTEPLGDEVGLETNLYRFSLENIGSIVADFTFYLDDVQLDDGQTRIDDQYIKYTLFREEDQYTVDVLNSHEKFTTDNGVVSRSIGSGTIYKREKYNYILKIWVADTAPNSIMNSSFKVKLRVDASQKKQFKSSRFVKAYTYSEDKKANHYCITGNEETCKVTTCYQDKTKGSCPAGTIIQYVVDGNDIVNFHVMFDEGDTITMQSQRNTINNTPWINEVDYIHAGGTAEEYGYDGNNNKGPLTALSVLDKITKGWNNVNDQTYTMGTTVFKTNAYTGCDEVSCSSNVYTLPEMTTRARMITFQEAVELGCNLNGGSCPIWMKNYLSQSTGYGGTANDSLAGDGYLTMSAASNRTVSARFLTFMGSVAYINPSYSRRGVRAVVEVPK